MKLVAMMRASCGLEKSNFSCRYFKSLNYSLNENCNYKRNLNFRLLMTSWNMKHDSWSSKLLQFRLYEKIMKFEVSFREIFVSNFSWKALEVCQTINFLRRRRKKNRKRAMFMKWKSLVYLLAATFTQNNVKRLVAHILIERNCRHLESRGVKVWRLKIWIIFFIIWSKKYTQNKTKI